MTEGNPETPRRQGLALGCLMMIFALVVGVLVARRFPLVSPETTVAPPAAPAPPPELPCVLEDCSERPHKLECEHAGTGVCYRYRIDYARACVCLKRSTQ